MLKPTLENLKSRLGSFTNHDWQVAVYAVEADSDNTSLNRVETLGEGPNPTVDVVANLARTVRTTLVGDLAKLSAALKKSPQYLPPKLRPLFEHQIVTDATGSVVGVPCFDPWQTITNDQNDRWVISVLTVWGTLTLEEIVGNADLRYLVEQYAATVASVLRPQRTRPKAWEGALQTLQDIQIFPELSYNLYVDPKSVGKVVVGKVAPLKVSGEQWVQFEAGLAISKAGLDAFQRARTRLQANARYVKESV